MTKTLKPQITTILKNAQTSENAISALNSLVKENKEFLDIRINSLEASISMLLPIALLPTMCFALSTLCPTTRKEYHKIFKDIKVSSSKVDFIYQHNSLNTLKAIFVPLAISSLHQTISWGLQAIKYYSYDEELVNDASQAIECLMFSSPASESIISICGNDGSFYTSE